jgi:transposase
MTKAYSVDLRERVVARVLLGESVRPVAAAFSVSVASVVRWSQRWRSTGSADPYKKGRNKSHVLDADRLWLLARFGEEADVTLRQLMAELGERGVEVSYGTLWNFAHQEGLSFKKKRSAQRAGSTGRCTISGALEEVSDQP